jgi:gamma-polyglutamate synthase
MLAVSGILLLLILVYFILESILVSKYVGRVPIRIHVNGTRGKSSVTRYIAAALRAAGYSTMGKITGVIPTIVNPDGTDECINRRGPAHLREQIRFLRRVSNNSCNALVVECMSIMPELQKIETAIFKPTITVLTNIYDDHCEVLGYTNEERLRAYCSALPDRAIIITGEENNYSAVYEASIKKNSKIIKVKSQEAQFPSSMNPDIVDSNVALAIETCRELQIDESLAKDAIIREALKQPSHCFNLRVGEYYVPFINGFAVNDTPSAEKFLYEWQKKLGDWNSLIFIINTRKDRPFRSLQFALWCGSIARLAAVIITGSHIPFTKRAMRESGISPDKIFCLKEKHIKPITQIFEKVVREKSAIFGFGNIVGDGFLIIERVSELSINECSGNGN